MLMTAQTYKEAVKSAKINLPLPDPWWIMRPDGNLLFVIYCLYKSVEIQAGVAAILIEGRENLILALKVLINIIRSGRLDRDLIYSSSQLDYFICFPRE